MITGIIVTLALIWLWGVSVELRVHALRRQVDRMCGIEDR